MFGGPPVPDTTEHTHNREPVGDYKLTHEMASIAETLQATPGRVLDVGVACPACGGPLLGRANEYTRSMSVWCSRCSFRVSR